MKTAIVTGASGNLGKAVVKKLLNSNYHVIGIVPPADKFFIDIDNPNFEKVELDLLNESASEDLVLNLLKKYSSIDVAVLTVGGFAAGNIAETSTGQIMQQVEVNFCTTYNIVRPVFKQMMQQSYGRLFMIGSRPGASASYSNGMVAYGLGKSLVFRLADLLNIESKGKNIVTSVVVPSTIDTPQNRLAMPTIDPASWVTVDQIADILYYHCTDEASSLRESRINIYGNS